MCDVKEFISIKDGLKLLSEKGYTNETLASSVLKGEVKCAFFIDQQYTASISGFSEGIQDAEIKISSLKKVSGLATPYCLKSVCEFIRGEVESCREQVVIFEKDVRILLTDEAYKLQEHNDNTLYGCEVESYIQEKELTSLNLRVNKSDLIKHFKLTEPSSLEKINSGVSPKFTAARNRARELAKLWWTKEQEDGKTETRLISMAELIGDYFKKHEPKHLERCKSKDAVKEWLKGKKGEEKIAPSYASKEGSIKEGSQLTYEMISANTDEWV